MSSDSSIGGQLISVRDWQKAADMKPVRDFDGDLSLFCIPLADQTYKDVWAWIVNDFGKLFLCLECNA